MKTKANDCGTIATANSRPTRPPARSFRHGFAWLAVIGVLLAGSLSAPAQTNYTILHAFTGATGDGAFGAGFWVTNSTIYGTTEEGGSNNAGTVYSIGTDGLNYTILHNFASSPPLGGVFPAGVELNGSTLYGVTISGGSDDAGTVYSVGTDGSGYQILHSFGSIPNDGTSPGEWKINGSTIYGITRSGGSNSNGTLYSIGTGGSGYQILHNFGSIPNDGMSPIIFTIVGSTIYGVTSYGGSNGSNDLYGPVSGGVLYSIATGGGSYQILHNFGSGTDGTIPGYFQVVGSTIYGLCEFGGSNGSNDVEDGLSFPATGGTVYSIGTGGSGYKTLYNFASSPTDGSTPAGFLIANSTIYGTCESGGSNDAGTVYSIATAGSNYQILHHFAASTPLPFSTSVSEDPGLSGIIGSTLYGLAAAGGSSSSGAVFSVETDGTGYQILHNFPAGPGDGLQPSDVMLVGSTLYGTTETGTDNSGVLYALALSGGAPPTKVIGLSGNLAFGSVTTGTTATATLTINNTGNTTLTVSSIAYPSGLSGAFSGTIPAGGSQPVTVTFAPTAVTSYSGTVTVTSDATSGTDTITASGAGVAAVTVTKIIGLSGNLAFGNVTTGTTATATLTINNTGNTTLTVSSIAYPSGLSGAFSGTIPAGGSQQVTVTFTPTAVTSYGGTVTVTSDATSGTDTITASGAGVAAVTLCTYTLSTKGVKLTAKGGSMSVSVKAKGTDCAWAAVSNDGFITITSGSSGTGNGKVDFTVSGNTNLTARTGTMTIVGHTVIVEQTLGGCTFKLSPTKEKIKADGGSATVKVTPNLDDCEWTAVSNDEFITITAGASGTGKGTVSYTVANNATTYERTGTLTLAGETFTITQAAAK